MGPNSIRITDKTFEFISWEEISLAPKSQVDQRIYTLEKIEEILRKKLTYFSKNEKDQYARLTQDELHMNLKSEALKMYKISPKEEVDFLAKARIEKLFIGIYLDKSSLLTLDVDDLRKQEFIQQAHIFGYDGKNYFEAMLYLDIYKFYNTLDFYCRGSKLLFETISCNKNGSINLEKTLNGFTALSIKDYLHAFQSELLFRDYPFFQNVLFSMLKNIKIEKSIEVQCKLNNIFILAIDFNVKEIYEYCLENGAQVDARDSDSNRSALEVAIQKNSKIFERLIKEGVSIDLVKKQGKNALYCAVQTGHTFFFKRLIKEGADINFDDEEGRNLLMESALLKGNREIFGILREKGIQIPVKDSLGRTRLMTAVIGGHIEFVKFFTIKKSEIDLTDEYGRTALMFAAMSKDKNILKFLVEEGAVINLQDKRNESALIHAIESNHIENVQYLIEQGAKDQGALIYAIWCQNREDIAKLLIEKGVGLETLDKDGVTPLICAASGNQLDIMKLLLQKKVNIYTKNSKGWTAFMYAAMFGSLECVECLLKEGADINEKDSEGWTVFMHAVRSNNLELMKRLKQKGADIHVRDKKGLTSLTYAMRYGHQSMVNWLKENGVKDSNKKRFVFF